MAVGEGGGVKGQWEGLLSDLGTVSFFVLFFFPPEPDPNPAFVPVTRQIPGPAASATEWKPTG